MAFELKKIALIGPESTGKSELCKALSAHYKTVWVEEYARHYISNLKKRYTLDDVILCAKMQLEQERVLSKKAERFLFCDTEFVNMKVWCSDVFNVLPSEVESMISNNRYDLHLLTYPDLPFVQDDVRENPHRREFFFEWYKRELENLQFPFEIIRGNGTLRLKNAIHAIEKHFAVNPLYI